MFPRKGVRGLPVFVGEHAAVVVNWRRFDAGREDTGISAYRVQERNMGKRG
jgi:hypothetical protein